MEKIKQFFKRDRLAEYIDIELIAVEEGAATAKMDVKEHHLNGIGTVQGGAIFTLADFTFAAAANSHGQVAVAINASISFVTAAIGVETLTAKATETSRNPKISTYNVDVMNEEGEIIAIFQGMAYIKKHSVEDLMSLEDKC